MHQTSEEDMIMKDLMDHSLRMNATDQKIPSIPPSFCWKFKFYIPNVDSNDDTPFNDHSNHSSMIECKIPLRAQTYSLKEVVHFIPGVFRFLTQSYISERLYHKRETPFDFFMRKGVTDPRRKGPPLGGIGSGSFTMSLNGWFTRHHLIFNQTGGVYNDTILPVNQFSIRVENVNDVNKATSFVLNPIVDFKDGAMNKNLLRNLKSNWKWINTRKGLKFEQEFMSLFPKSWTVYKSVGGYQQLTLVCEKYSPVIAHNYKESSYPTALFNWTIFNEGDEDLNISLMFTFQSDADITKNQPQQRIHNKHSTMTGTLQNGQHCKGVVMETSIKDSFSHQDPLQFCIGATCASYGISETSSISCVEYFNAMDSTQLNDMWKQFENFGSFDDENFSKRFTTTGSSHTATQQVISSSAVCVKIHLPPKSQRQVTFNMNWHSPIVRFGPSLEYIYLRHYMKYFQDKPLNSSDICWNMCKLSLQSSSSWSNEIDRWYTGVISSMPNATAMTISALFNELYYVIDGGTVWTFGEELRNDQLDFSQTAHELVCKMNQQESSPQEKSSSSNSSSNSQSINDYFSYLEGHEYLMHNTYDVHFYASHAMIVNWPAIQLSIQRDNALYVKQELPQETTFFLSNMKNKRKVLRCVPHDVGTPCERPWKMVNSYPMQDTNKWKDLNSQFIISIYRDYVYTKDEEFLKQVYPSVLLAMNYHLENFDKDKDGLIENEDFPDTTYDAWIVTGVSAYSGGLWIAALQCANQMALLLKDTETSDRLKQLIPSALQSYESKLWDDTNSYYHYDTSSHPQHDSIMADHLHGPFMLLLIGHQLYQQGEIESPYAIFPFNMERVRKSFDTVLQHNIKHFQKVTGIGGVINGIRPHTKQVDSTSLQSREVWTGTSYVVAALALLLGHEKDGFDLVESIFSKGAWSLKFGFWFQTPEAITENGEYRALGYMRPLAVWACYSAAIGVHSQL
ncbi:hypothetical protein C9374_010027 [Naegleria lovaniensis]|uniref:NLGase n=1 Tax=Naegleria lovaniensis TaxID=51637 RepID=A0AA88GH10_NAELO|nr:uncharacterized protein C9374_010027 [Naegleria lovaniensis]KAG2375023.1 hypothetical protein C9374_010027 [Naegleria lovaniensis]